VSFCARCDNPILPGEGRRTYPIDSGSAAAADVTVHSRLCEMPDHQVAPALTRSQQFEERLQAMQARQSRFAATR
jgi:hypothetical protein